MERTDFTRSPEIAECEYDDLIGVLLDRHITPVVDECLRAFFEREQPANRTETEFVDPETVELALMDEVQKFLGVVEEKFPTVEQLAELLNLGDVDCVFLKDDVNHRLLEAVDREKSMLNAGYDTMMEGFINYRSRVGEKVLDRVAGNLIKKSRETGSPLALILLDLDDFKGVNDYGHLVGNEVLKHMAVRISEEVRNSIRVRLGGEEIAVILDDISVEDAVKVALRINGNLNRNPGMFIADAADPDSPTVENAIPISRERFLKLREMTGRVIKRRAVERVIADPRSRSASGHLKLLEIPISASMGVVKINTEAEDPVMDAVRRANDQEIMAKRHGKNQVWAGNRAYHNETPTQEDN